MAIVREYKATTVDGRIEPRFRMVRSRTKPLKAGDRKGFNSRSGMASMLDPELAEVERPTVDKVVQLIRVQYVGHRDKESGEITDVLTAQGHALYEFLMAAARIQGIEKQEFRVLMTDAKKFVNIKHNDRLRGLAQQLHDTKVRYDFVTKDEQWDGLMNLLSVDYVTTRADGKTYLSYIIHPRVKRVITESTRWAKLDINAFPKFRCKYTPRIYPHFQLHAQTHAGLRKSYIIEPKKFAELVGFVYSGDFHFGNFEKGCLRPIMKDFGDDFSLSLSVQMEPYHRAPGRGNPVWKLEFILEPRDYLRPMGDSKLRHMEGAEFERLAKLIREDATTLKEWMPTAALLLKAALRLNREPVDLLEMWKENVAKAFAYPTMEIQFGLKGQDICDLLETRSGPTAFELWAKSVDPIPERIWAMTQEEFEQNIGHEDLTERSIDGAYVPASGGVIKTNTWVDPTLEGVISGLRAIPAEEADLPHQVEYVKQVCSTKHPAFGFKLRSLLARIGERYETIEDAMQCAASDRPAGIDRIGFILAVCKWAVGGWSDRADEALVAAAKLFDKKVRQPVSL
ncbi:replication initiation protein [Rhizobium leguminosarum]|uniref:replication initiation protein n=1 Tax=Rhizobium leguminosarum TaxID=384 RepID=UPI0010305EB0|nr:replication initiation protein [Rhizobium leguminosarum]TAW50619.1 RepB family plasmid replication initiator protein [Rhizobium leguminosarum]